MLPFADKARRLQDEATKLRKKIEEKDSEMKGELGKLNEEICRLHSNIIDIEKKSDHFSKVNDWKFQEIWKMKTNEANELVGKILDADKIIHEEILGMEWTSPSTQPLQLDHLPSYKSALSMINQIFNNPDNESLNKEKMENDEGENVRLNKVLREVLTLISDNAGFLLEERLEELLEPYSEDERTLVRLDNVFSAIGVKNKEEMDQVHFFFMPYVVCTSCPNQPCAASIADAETARTEHSLFIKKNNVLKALREFVSKLHASKIRERSERADVKLAKDRCTVSRLISTEDIKSYWESYENIFQGEKIRVWDALYDGLSKYYITLQEREKLMTKAKNLRQQNEELMVLAEKYLPVQTATTSKRTSTAAPSRNRRR